MNITTAKPESHLSIVHSVGVLCVNGGRFAEISYGTTGQMSVNIEQADPVAGLFAAADAEFEHASQIMRRAMLMRRAAWKLSKERTSAADLARTRDETPGRPGGAGCETRT